MQRHAAARCGWERCFILIPVVPVHCPQQLLCVAITALQKPHHRQANHQPGHGVTVEWQRLLADMEATVEQRTMVVPCSFHICMLP